MIVCERCGFENEDADTFCGSCAAFLEWSGQKVAEAPPDLEPEPPAEAASDPHPRIIERVKERIGLGADADGRPGEQAARPPQEAGRLEEAAAGLAPGAPEGPGNGLNEAGQGAAAAPLAEAPNSPAFTSSPPKAPEASAPPPEASAPVCGPVPPLQPEAVKPGAARARPSRRSKPAPVATLSPGDLVCGQCGQGNDPARNFCRRCGASLKAAAVFRLSWWARLGRLLWPRKIHAAGERPGQRRRAFGGSGPGWLTSWLARAVVIAAIAFAVLANVGPYKSTIRHHLVGWYHDVISVVHPSYVAVHPISATATSSAPGHPASYAIDGLANTCWQTGPAASGVGQSITIKLAKPTNIDKIGFLSGDQDTPQAYLTEPRPSLLHVVFAAASPSAKDLLLKDTPKFQSFGVDAKDASSLTITIESVYPSPKGQDASIAEVELFSRS